MTEILKKPNRWDLKKQIREQSKQIELLKSAQVKLKMEKTKTLIIHSCPHCRGHKI